MGAPSWDPNPPGHTPAPCPLPQPTCSEDSTDLKHEALTAFPSHPYLPGSCSKQTLLWSVPIPRSSQGLALGDTQYMLIKCHDSSKAFSGSSLPTSQPAPQHRLSSGMLCAPHCASSSVLRAGTAVLHDLPALGEAHRWFPLFVCHWSQC